MDAVATATAALPRLYPANAVPPTPTYPYGVYSAQLGRADGYTLDATHGLRWVRVTFQAFGRTATSVLDLTERFLTATLDVRLTFDSYTASPLTTELDPTPPLRDPDDNGVLGVTTTLTATAAIT